MDSRIPARLIEPQAVDLSKTVADEVAPLKVTAGTKVALLQGTLRNKEQEKAAAKARGCCLTKSTFGDTTTYELIGDGPRQVVLTVVDNGYKGSQPSSSSRQK